MKNDKNNNITAVVKNAVIIFLAFQFICILALCCSFATNTKGNHLSSKKLTLYAGESGCFVEMLDSKDRYVKKKCSWSVSDRSAFELEDEDQILFFRPLKKGRYTITCKCGGKKYKCKVAVKAYKKEVKVLGSCIAENGDVIQLVRIKNLTKKPMTAEVYDETTVNSGREVIAAGKCAYLPRNASHRTEVFIYRGNWPRTGRVENICPDKNVSSKVKGTISVTDNGKYRITLTNKAAKKRPRVDITYVLYDAEGKPVEIGEKNINGLKKAKWSGEYECRTAAKAASARIYVNAVCY